MTNGALPWLKTAGNKIVTENGQEVMLRGANIMRAEFDNTMDWEERAIPELAEHWHGTILTRGFASDPVNSADAGYLGLLDELVALAKANRMYLLLAWRSFGVNGEQPPMPTAAAQQALATLAARYKDQSHVMYALQVEPHDTSDGPDWSILRPLFENMVDAIRAVVARPDVPADQPLIMIPGRNWSRNVSGAITDPVNRPNVVYKSHPYNPSSDFQNLFGDTHDAGLPVFVGEFAPSDAEEDTNMSMDDITDLLAFTRDRGIGWAAWLLDFGTHALMNETDLSPTTPYGTTVKAEMLTTPPIP